MNTILIYGIKNSSHYIKAYIKMIKWRRLSGAVFINIRYFCADIYLQWLVWVRYCRANVLEQGSLGVFLYVVVSY
jgi:hypothetical protein